MFAYIWKCCRYEKITTICVYSWKQGKELKKYKFLFVKRQKKQNCMFIVIFIWQLSKNTFIWNSERIDRILKKVVPGWETSMVGRSFTIYLSYWTMWMYTQFKILRNNISLLYFGNWGAITSVVKKACFEHLTSFTIKLPWLGSIWFQSNKSLDDFYKSFITYWFWRKNPLTS